jgi:hypothetical protein
MGTFLTIWGIITLISVGVMWYGIKNAKEVPQEIDIYDL